MTKHNQGQYNPLVVNSSVVQMFHYSLLFLLGVMGWGKVLSKKQSAWVFFSRFWSGGLFCLFCCGGRFVCALLISGELLLRVVWSAVEQS